MVGGQTRVSAGRQLRHDRAAARTWPRAAAAAKARELHLSGMNLNGGVGQASAIY